MGRCQVSPKLQMIGAGLLAFSLLGCGSAGRDLGPTGTVTGMVTYQGQPVTEGKVFFQSVHGAANGNIGSDGAYTLLWQGRSEGIPAGEYRVYILPPASSRPDPDDEDAPRTFDHPMIPAIYQQAGTSELKMTVIEGEANSLPIKME